ncbi:hypothetical protein [Salinibacter altiplanensis]|uniref:hypothetical protein n=1 Tax=Salinibacter altiplanensis TaxID=1803181 RepID=UPI001E3FECDE|nr:hypothetical protein [Salinibacter altiplanensis]
MLSSPVRWALPCALGLLAMAATGCTAFREVANLRKVQFSIDRVAQPRLAGVDLSRVQSYDDLRGTDVLRLGSALSDGTLPLSFTLHLNAENPSSNSVNARLTQMDWTLLLEDKETVSGRFERERVLSPGEPTEVPVDVELDLVRFFDDNLQGLVDLAAAIRGDALPQTLKLRVQPTVNTKVGSIQYPSPITVVRRSVGQDSQQP